MQNSTILNGEYFFVTLKRGQAVCDVTHKATDYIRLKIGTHKMKRIPDPRGMGRGDWLVLSDALLRGKIIGGSEIFWDRLTKINPNVEIETITPTQM